MSTVFKNEFLFKKEESNITYMSLYKKLFREISPYEDYFGRDLHEFSKENLIMVFERLAYKIKLTTAMTYNSLLEDYKNYLRNIGIENVSDEALTLKELKKIKFRTYEILNDHDIARFTTERDIFGVEYNCAIFIKLYWETKGSIEPEEILKVRIYDFDFENKCLKYPNKFGIIENFPLSNWLLNMVQIFSEMDCITFMGKNGKYDMLTAIQNNGYIFRVSSRANSKKAGTPIDIPRFSRMLYEFMKDRADETISINDLKMSLALKHMLENQKTPQEMFMSKLFFKNLPSRIYADVFYRDAKEKFPRQYNEYISYFQKLEQKYSKMDL